MLCRETSLTRSVHQLGALVPDSPVMGLTLAGGLLGLDGSLLAHGGENDDVFVAS